MLKSKSIVTAAMTVLMSTGAWAAPQYGHLAWPRLADVGPEVLSGMSGLHPTVAERSEAMDLVRLRSTTGTEALVEARDGSLFAADDATLNAFLSEVDENLEEILHWYRIGLDDDPLCPSCDPLGLTVEQYNRDILVLLENLYTHELPVLDLTYDFARHFDYTENLGLYDQMLALADLAAMMSMVDGRVLVGVGQGWKGERVELYHFDVVAGDPRSGEIGRETPDGITIKADIDVDNDGYPNWNDGDIDGDGWPNWLDSDKDGDGVPNRKDDTPNGDAGGNGLIIMTTGGHDHPWRRHYDGNPDALLDHDLYVLNLYQHVNAFIETLEARLIIADFTLGNATRTETLAALDALYLAQYGGAAHFTAATFR